MATHASRDTTTGKVNEINIEQFLTENYDYLHQPHEIAARKAEEILYKEYYEERLESLC